MTRPRISDEWLMGATLGAYVVLTAVLSFWGSAFFHWFCVTYPEPYPTPSTFFLLIPALAVGALEWAQLRLIEFSPALVGRRAVRAAFWMNLFGIMGFIVAVASKYNGEDAGAFWTVVALFACAFWPVGLLLSLVNMTRASIRWMKLMPVPSKSASEDLASPSPNDRP
jgi:hypothetical protein